MRPARATLPAALFALVALAPAASWAQARRWSFGAELGGGTMLHDFDHDAISAGTATFEATARVGFRVVGPLAAQASAVYGRFLRDRRALPLVGGTLGVRFEPRVGTFGRLWIDANAGVYIPGTATRFGFDAGLGFAFEVLPVLEVGPFARFSHVFDGREGRATLDLPYVRQATQDTDDIHWWTAGVSITLHLPAKAPRATGENR